MEGNKEHIAKSEIDINSPGILVKGIDTDSLDILDQILHEGLKPKNVRENPSKSHYTVVPDYVSLSMVGKSGYKHTSAAFLWGASDRGISFNLTVVLDPRYVQEHSDKFIAAGEGFK